MEKPKTLFERLARERGISVEEMRAIISARIEQGMNDPDILGADTTGRGHPDPGGVAPICGGAVRGGRSR